MVPSAWLPERKVCLSGRSIWDWKLFCLPLSTVHTEVLSRASRVSFTPQQLFFNFTCWIARRISVDEPFPVSHYSCRLGKATPADLCLSHSSWNHRSVNYFSALRQGCSMFHSCIWGNIGTITDQFCMKLKAYPWMHFRKKGEYWSKTWTGHSSCLWLPTSLFSHYHLCFQVWRTYIQVLSLPFIYV